jgi:type II secretory pathway pseudopilin PulG
MLPRGKSCDAMRDGMPVPAPLPGCNVFASMVTGGFTHGYFPPAFRAGKMRMRGHDEHQSQGNKGTRGTKAKRNGGFTLVEVLAALLFLAILVPVIVGALSATGRVSELATRRAVATELAENQMNEELIGNEWQTDPGSGDFGTNYPGYRWQMTQNTWAADATNPMTELSVEVFFPVQGREQSVKLTTLVNPSATTTQTPLPSGTTAGGTSL